MKTKTTSSFGAEILERWKLHKRELTGHCPSRWSTMKFLIDVYLVGKSSKLEEKESKGHHKLISIVNSAGRCSLASHTLYLSRNHHATIKLLPCILIDFLGDLWCKGTLYWTDNFILIIIVHLEKIVMLKYHYECLKMDLLFW